MKGKFNPTALDRPYFLAFFAIMTGLLTLTKKLNLDDKIDFIFDSQDSENKVMLMTEYDKFLSVAPPGVKELSGGYPILKKDEEVRPLQAADMLAWHARRYYFDLDRGKDPTKEPSNEYFANLFLPENDVIDIWTEEKLRGAANALYRSVSKQLPGLGLP
jgi:hypothetical protein